MVTSKLSVDSAFTSLLAAIKPTADERAQASTSQNHVRDVLRNAEARGEIPWLLDYKEFLSGSYIRHTKITPLDDVDLMFPLDGTGLSVTSGGVQRSDVVEGSGTTGSPILTSAYDNADGHKSSIKVLNAFKAVLDSYYDRSEVKRNGQAINIWLSTYGMGLDIVPCFHVMPLFGQDVYYIPVGGGGSNWMKTNPKLAQEMLDKDAAQSWLNGNLKPVIMFMKYWNREKNYSRLESYHVECMVWDFFKYTPMHGYASAVTSFLAASADRIAGACPDPTGIGSNIDDYLTDDARQKSKEAATDASEWAGFANTYSALGNVEKALECWSHVFGSAILT